MKKIVPFLLFVLFVAQISAQSSAEKFVDNSVLRNANISLLVYDLNAGKTISEIFSNQSIIPASTMKLITTATALELLGSDFCFETKLQIANEIDENGVLNGNLYIYGGGDPTLGSAFIGNRDFLKQWLNAVKKAGIKQINGNIVADASLFDDEGINPQWSWEDIGNYYAPGIYGISYMDNTARVHLNSGRIGSIPTITKTVPEIPGLLFENHLRSTAIGKDSAYFYGAPHSNLRTIYGEIPANRNDFITKTDIPDPALLLAQHVHELLIENGIRIVYPPGTQYRGNRTERKTIYTHFSPPLSRIVKEINFTSNNHYSEHVFRYLALQDSSVATTNGAIGVVQNYWKQKGLPVEQLFMSDGSGLSRTNAVSAGFYVKLLAYMKKQSKASRAFYDSLPVAGESGTIAWILKNTSLQGKLRAKSGSLSRVRCYAGYIDMPSKNYAFVVLMNNYNGLPNAAIREMEKYLISVVNE